MLKLKLNDGSTLKLKNFIKRPIKPEESERTTSERARKLAVKPGKRVYTLNVFVLESDLAKTGW